MSLTAAADGSITLEGANLDIEGTLSSPEGSLTLAAYDFSPYEFAVLRITPEAQTPPVDSTRGNLILGRTAILSTAGLVSMIAN